MMMKANEESKSRKNYPDFFVDAPYCTRQFWATLFRSLIKGGRGKGGGAYRKFLRQGGRGDAASSPHSFK